MPNTVWQLRGLTDKVLECHVNRTPTKAHALTVVLGHETFLHETYPDESSALSRARQVCERLVNGGSWTVVSRSAVGRSSR